MKPLSKTDLQLYEVKRHIENGWCRGQYVDAHGNVCIWGAIMKATGIGLGDALEHEPVVQRLEAALFRKINCGISLMSFNDSSPTKERVVGLVQEAIEAGG